MSERFQPKLELDKISFWARKGCSVPSWRLACACILLACQEVGVRKLDLQAKAGIATYSADGAGPNGCQSILES